ncbi:MAG TPA: hypothetical protein VKZ82_08435 [Nonomuraea sp.]|uniref:hypothetical protein n=1 Tax=Nonomuraea sp. NPDC049649 TaxID=3155776 RepID=UPI002C3A544A|nr:hypothetical protein [Nonomuraea sp.]
MTGGGPAGSTDIIQQVMGGDYGRAGSLIPTSVLFAAVRRFIVEGSTAGPVKG